MTAKDGVLSAKAELESGAITLTQLGKRLGITRERIRQLVNDLGIRWKTPPLHCSKCGGERTPDRARSSKCWKCVRIPPVTFSATCTWCGKVYVKTGPQASTAKINLKNGHAPTCPDCFQRRAFVSGRPPILDPEERIRRARKRVADYCRKRYHSDPEYRAKKIDQARNRRILKGR